LVSIAENVPINVVLRQSFKTTTPDETLAAVFNWLKDKQIDALGIACFGPVDLDTKSKTYGFITSTPKPGWQFVDVVGRFKALGSLSPFRLMSMRLPWERLLMANTVMSIHVFT